MTILLHRMAVASVALAVLAAQPLMAQTAPGQGAPPTSPQAVVPRIEQRFELPRHDGLRVQIGDLQVIAREVRSYRPVFRLGQPFVLRADEIADDVRVVLGDVRIEGRVEGDVVAVLGNVTLGESAVIEGALVVVGGDVNAPAAATVDRELVLVGGALDAADGFAPRGDQVVIGTAGVGQSLRSAVPWLTRGLLWGRVIVPGLRWMWVLVGVAFLVGLILNVVFNQPVASCAQTLARRPLAAFVAGLLTVMLLPVLIVILAASVIGLVAVPFVVAACVAAALIGRITVSRAIGRLAAGESDPPGGLEATRSFAIGSVVLVLAYATPIVGLVTWMFAGAFGLGAVVLTFAGTLRRERPVPAAAPMPAAPTGPSSPDASSGEPAAAVAAPDFVPVSPIAAPVFLFPPPSAPASNVGGAMRALMRYPRASFLDRVAAIALDVVLVGIAAAFLGFGRYRGPGPFFMLLLAYHVAFWAWKGTTLGGIICGLRVVRTNETALRFADALVRGLSGIFSFVALGIGFFWMLGDAERQTWHDKIAGTVVVKVPRELVLE